MYTAGICITFAFFVIVSYPSLKGFPGDIRKKGTRNDKNVIMFNLHLKLNDNCLIHCFRGYGRQGYLADECCSIYQNCVEDVRSTPMMRNFETPRHHRDQYSHYAVRQPPLPHPYPFYPPTASYTLPHDVTFDPYYSGNLGYRMNTYSNEPFDRRSHCFAYAPGAPGYGHPAGSMLPPGSYPFSTPGGADPEMRDHRDEGPPIFHRRIKATNVAPQTQGKAPPTQHRAPPPPPSEQYFYDPRYDTLRKGHRDEAVADYVRTSAHVCL